MPRASPVGVTYAETGQFPLSLRAKACALRHIERMHMTRGGKALVHRLLSLPDTGMGRSALEYASLISGAPFAGLLPIPPHWDSRLPISTRVPGVRSKGNTPRAALLQETCALIEQRYGKLGLPHVSAEHLLFPSANVATLRRAFYALLDFFGDANLFTRL
ncbi:hypothetical protein MRX96_024496 [Rhipicephalus microplus]